MMAVDAICRVKPNHFDLSRLGHPEQGMVEADRFAYCNDGSRQNTDLFNGS